MKTTFRKFFWLLFLTIMLLGIPKLSGLIADQFSYQAFDPDGAFAWISVHHIAQTLFFILFIILSLQINGILPLHYGFGLGDKKTGLTYLLKFVIIFGSGSLVNHAILLFSGSLQPLPFPMTLPNVGGYLGFQLLLSGPSEELIFRAFAITMISMVVPGRLFKGLVSYSNIIAAVIFALAHVGFSFEPFALQYNSYQLLMSFILGLFYGDCYEKSGSVVYPMAMHSLSNVIMVGLTMLGTLVILK